MPHHRNFMDELSADPNVDPSAGLAAATAEAMTEAMTGLAAESLAGAATGEQVMSAAALFSEAQSWMRISLPAPATDTPGARAITTAAFGFLEPGASVGGSVLTAAMDTDAAIATTVLLPTAVEAGLNADFADVANPRVCHLPDLL
jgi:hypothetical protein